MNKLQGVLLGIVLLCSSAYAFDPDIIYVDGKPVYIEGLDLTGTQPKQNVPAATTSNPNTDIYRGHMLGESTSERNTQYGEIYRGTVFGKEAATGFAGEVAHAKNTSKTKLLYDTSLIHAIKIGDADRVRTLIYANVDVNERNFAGMTPLTIAAEKDNYEIVRLLVEEGGADVNATSSYGITPLIAAASGGHREAVELLLKNGADATATDASGRTALIHAMTTNNRRLTEALAKSNATAINIPDNTGNTPLIYAATKGNADNVRSLLKYQADPDYQNPSGASALIAAAANSHDKVAQYLVSANASLDLRDNNGRTALFYAAKNGQTNLARLLLRKGAFANTVDVNGTNALMAAAQADDTSIMRILTPQYITMESVDREGKTPLMYSTASKGGVKALQWLISKGAVLNARDFNGNTALMHAIKNKNSAAATLLLGQQDIDTSAVNKQQQDAFSLAQQTMPGSQVLALLQAKRGAGALQQAPAQFTATKEYAQQQAAVLQQINATNTAIKQQTTAKQQALRQQAEQELMRQDAELAALQKQLEDIKARREALLQGLQQQSR